MVSEITFIYNAVYTATYNVHRKKNKRALKLWKKRKTHKADDINAKDIMQVVRDMEEKIGKSWVDKIYEKNGMKPPERRKHA